MAKTLTQSIADAIPYTEELAERIQPKVQEVVRSGGTTVRNVLDGVWFEVPLHPVLTDVPIGSWTAAATFDALETVTGSRAMRNAADATVALGVAGGIAAAAVGLSDWRYTSGVARRTGMAHAIFNSAGLTLSVTSLALRALGRRRAGKLAFLAGFSCTGIGAHIGGELSYKYGLRVNRNVFEGAGPDEFRPVLDESDLAGTEMRRVEVDEVGVLLTRSTDGEVCAIAATCNHFSGPLEQGKREGDTVVCPWHGSRFDLCSGQAIDGPAVFPQSTYETRVREGKIEIRANQENIQEKVR